MKKSTIKDLRIFAVSSLLTLTMMIYPKKDDIALYYKCNPYIDFIFNTKKTEEIVETITDGMDQNPFLANNLTSSGITKKEEFLLKFSSYLEENSEHFDYFTIITLREGLKRYQEQSVWTDGLMIDFFNTFSNALASKDDEIRGIEEAYVTSVIKYYFNSENVLNHNKLYDLFEEITDIIPRDRTNEYMLKKNITGLKMALKEAYKLESAESLNRMVDLFRIANSLEDETCQEYQDCYEELQKIANELYNNRLTEDWHFLLTLQGQIAHNRINMQEGFEYKDKLTRNYNGTINVQLHDDAYGVLYLNQIDSVEPRASIFTKELKEKYVTDFLERTLLSEDTYHTHIWNLLSYIVDFTIIDDTIRNENVGQIYSQLEPYFENQEQINNFIIALKNNNEKAYKKYFEIFVSKCINTENPVQALAEARSLEEYYNQHVLIHSTFIGTGEEVLDSKKVAKNSEEATQYKTFIEDYYFGGLIPDSYFEEIKKHVEEKTGCISDTNVGLYEIREWRTGKREYRADSKIFVYSPEISAITYKTDDKQYVYYLMPDYYTSSASCVRTFINIDNEFIEENVPGEIMTITNPITHKEELGYVIYTGKDMPENSFKPIQIRMSLAELNKYLTSINGDNLTLKYINESN